MFLLQVGWVADGPSSGLFRFLHEVRTNGDGFFSVNLWFVRRNGFSGPFGLGLFSAQDATHWIGDGNTPRLTNKGLIDAVVIGWEDSPAEQTLLDVLTPGRPQVQETESFSHRDESLSRCLINGSWTFVPAHASRDGPNHCPTRANPDVMINEINLASDHQFIELFDLGAGYTLLSKNSFLPTILNLNQFLQYKI